MAPPCPHSFTPFTFVAAETLVATCRLCDLVVIATVVTTEGDEGPWLQVSYATPDGEVPDNETANRFSTLVQRVEERLGRRLRPPHPPPVARRRFRPREDPRRPTPDELAAELGDDLEDGDFHDPPRQMSLSFPSIAEWDDEAVSRFQWALNRRGQERGYQVTVALRESQRAGRTLRLAFSYAPPAAPG